MDNGFIIRNVVMEYKLTNIETDMKDNLQIIWNKGLGFLSLSMVINLLVTGKTILNMERELNIILSLNKRIKVNFHLDIVQEKVKLFIVQVIFSKDIGKIT